MADKVEFELVSPEKLLISQPVDMVVVPGSEGNFGVLPGHAPFLGALTENHTRITLVDGTVLDVAVHGGFVQVSGTTVSILSDVAELGDQIDRARAQAAKERAEERLRHETQDAEAEAALGRAHARLNATGGLGVSASH